MNKLDYLKVNDILSTSRMAPCDGRCLEMRLWIDSTQVPSHNFCSRIFRMGSMKIFPMQKLCACGTSETVCMLCCYISVCCAVICVHKQTHVYACCFTCIYTVSVLTGTWDDCITSSLTATPWEPLQEKLQNRHFPSATWTRVSAPRRARWSSCKPTSSTCNVLLSIDQWQYYVGYPLLLIEHYMSWQDCFILLA